MSSILPVLKRLILADKAAVVAAIVGSLGILAARFGLKLNASDTAYLATGVSMVLGLLVQAKHSVQKSAGLPEPTVVHVHPAFAVNHPAPVVDPQVVEEVQDTFPHPEAK